MKIAVPWPVKESGQPRIKEALSLWSNQDDIVLCCAEETDDEFVKKHHHLVMPRNTKDIGTVVPKCYIRDMIQETIKAFPQENWYGFGNSDCVPMGEFLEDSEGYDILIFHRTDIKEWDNRFEPAERDELKERVWKMRQRISDKKVARTLNLENVPRPNGEYEWTYRLVEKFCEDQGRVFIHGQDLYLFRRTVVDQVLKDYLIPKDPILGTGAFDPRLTYWCMNNHKSVRILHRLFHKKHDSEWNPDEVEFKHNGGVLTEEEWPTFFEDEFLLNLAKEGHRGSMSGWFMMALRKYNRALWEELVAD